MPISRTFRSASRQAGFTLIEILVSLLVFAVGVLALVGLQASAIRFATDAQQRAEATFLADQLLARMLIADPATSASFAHRPDGGAVCAPTGSSSSHPAVLEWLDEVTRTFPNASADEQQIIVSGTNEVTVRLCWVNGPGDSPHQLVVSNRVQWQ